MVKAFILMEKDTLDTFPSSSVPVGTFRYDPASPHRLEVWDGTTWQRLAFQSDPSFGSYAPGSFTLATGKYMVMVNHLILAGSQSAVLQGTSSLVIQRGT